jgi:putative tricarboxylic transport membrane protein
MRNVMTRYRDFWTASLLFSFASVLIAAGTNLPLGTAARMGPGFIPRAAAIALLLIAAAIAIRGVLALRRNHAGETMPAFHWRGAASIGGAVLAFALFIQPAGLLASATIAVFVSSLAQTGSHLPERVLLATSLAGFAGLVFSVALGLPISIFPHGL